MVSPIRIGSYNVGQGYPVFIIAEIGINHNGSLATALELIDVAHKAGVNMVKFQKRTPEICVPLTQRSVMRDTPWGRMTYMEYREKIEFDLQQFSDIAKYCDELGMLWTASSWDVPSVEFLAGFDVPCHKVPSACLTDDTILKAMRRTGQPIILSTGMSTPNEIEHAFSVCYDGLPPHPTVLLHCTSTYPCPEHELNLRCITSLQKDYPDVPIGYSGHEAGIPPTLAAVALGACVVERHITLDRTMWGSDHAASLEPLGLQHLVGGIRAIEAALGDGNKRVYTSEEPIKAKLRGDYGHE